ncbi:threonine/serine exporter family protein [Fuchsiella alkaliacetigena]|uniref:threonine/serine exporter family protein n=1 Tax=Fuchsiella alkaliacetigena TaxID=957042 RepID=UPI00200A1919|nr:threonine/serine exporter family protein [Fuchsiella alkaliacetigena]MCK8823847.1 threonine/serine exporter family protein [Fuchsiella alkaliacetigena]
MQQQVLLLVTLVGETLLKSGAETHRVEETIIRIGNAYNFNKIEVFALPTGIFISLEDQSGESLTKITRIKHQLIDLKKVSLVNDLSRRIVAKKITLEEALLEMNDIKSGKDSYAKITSYLAAGIGGMTFTYFTFGSGWELLGVFWGAFLLEMWLENNKINKFISQIISGFIASFFGVGLSLLWPSLDKNAIILGIVIILVPGLAITNAARDLIAGDSLAGIIRGINALLTALGIALGVAAVLGLRSLV